jgi:DNA-binding response OmpR family regulator
LSEEQISRLRAELAETKAALREAYARIAELELTRPAHGIDLRQAICPGLTRTQACVLAILCDGRAHTWWAIQEALELLVCSRAAGGDQLIRTVMSAVRRYLRERGLQDAIETMPRLGYRIRSDRLEAVRALFIHS